MFSMAQVCDHPLQVVEKLIMLLNEHGMSLRATSSDGAVLTKIVELVTAPRNGDDVTISSQEREVLTAGQIPTAGWFPLA